jgi:hypothetical protein
VDCEILRTLYIRADGEIPCHDDAGERVPLGRAAADPTWSIEQVFGNERFQRIRLALADGRAPWPGICERCAFLRRDAPCVDTLRERRIGKLQVEPSLRCTLGCPACSQAEQLRRRPGPHVLDPALLDRVLSSCAESGYRIDIIEYCGQGEPLTHPRLAELVHISRARQPGALQRLITNGNGDYRRALRQERVDELIVSCDGLHQASYEQYRVRGSVDRALKFMADATAEPPGSRPYVIWKYILFEFNDGVDEVVAAQRRARAMGVDELRFVVTHSAFRSQRFTSANAHTLPIVDRRARVATTPLLARDARSPALLQGPLGARAQRDLAALHVAISRRPRLRRAVVATPGFRSLKRWLDRIA